jgi:hypothetical protein
MCVLNITSLTMQASVLHFCKENKFFKSQNQQNSNAEEDEESQDADEEDADEEVVFIEEQSLFQITFQKKSIFNCRNLNFKFPSSFKKIPIPPPKY